MRIKVNPDGSYGVAGSVNHAEVAAAVKAAAKATPKAAPKSAKQPSKAKPEPEPEPELELPTVEDAAELPLEDSASA